MSKLISIGLDNLSIEEVCCIANQDAKIKLSVDPIFKERINKGPKLVLKLLEEKHVIYGVNTGVGENCGSFVPPELIALMPGHVIQFHGCALGRFFTVEETRAIMTAR